MEYVLLYRGAPIAFCHSHSEAEGIMKRNLEWFENRNENDYEIFCNVDINGRIRY